MAGPLQRADLDAAQPTAEPGIIPVQYVEQIIQEARVSSMALGTFRNVRIPTKVNQLPVLDALPVASWVNGEPDDTDGSGGEKASTEQKWKGITLTAEEIAAIVVIPEAVLEDSSINLWAEITPRIAESIGIAIDAAVFKGTNAPTSFGNGIIADAVTATNVIVDAAPDSADYNAAFGLVEADGFMVNQVYAGLGQKANFRGWNAAGVPIFLSDLRDDGRVDSIYGTSIAYDEAGVFAGTPNTLAVVGDPSKAIIGTRTDMQTKILTEAMVDVSAAQDGSAMVNLAQQDSVALRVRARFGFVVANPYTHANPVEATRYPFAVINDA